MKADLLTESELATTVNVSSYVAGTGMNVPDRVITNDYFASYLETTDEWIKDRTGISERRWVDKDIGASELAEPAARAAIKSAGLSESDIDGIVFATVTPDYIFPSSACVLQGRLGIRKGLAFDVNAVCSGFLYALVMADSLITTGQCSNVLVVGSEIYSKIINPKDRTTCVLFGDGAGALVLRRATSGDAEAPGFRRPITGSSATLRGIYGSELRSDGSQREILYVPNGTAAPATPERIANGDHFLKMAGREVFKLAVRSLVDVSQQLLARLNVPLESVDYFVSHQANKRILMAMAKQLGVDESKVLSNVEHYGNTSAASLPILLAESAQKGVLKPGDLVLLSAFGGGVTWGASLIRW